MTAQGSPSPSLPRGPILVTGAAGFIGSALVWHLNRLGRDDIFVTDVLDRTERWKNLVPLRFIDYVDAAPFLDKITAEPRAFGDLGTVFHLGACSATTETDSAYLLRNNYEYTKSMARWALSIGARFVYASSAATYGDGDRGMDDDAAHIEKLRPLNMYAYSKQLFDLHARREGLLDRIVGLKYFNVYGPNEGHKGDMRSLVHKAFEQIRDTGRLKLFKSHRPDYKDGEQKRDFLYVKDAVSMSVHLAANPKANGLFNLGAGTARSWLDLAAAVFSAMGKETAIDFVDMPESLRAKYQYFTEAKIARLRAAGYSATITSLEDAVRDYVTNYMMTGQGLGTAD